MSTFIKNLGKALVNIIKLLIFLGILFLGWTYRDDIFPYILNGKSYYEVYLGDKEYKQGNYQDAIEHYRIALELYPKHLKARYNLANIYVVYEDFPEAVQEYQTVLKYDPDYVNARISLGIILAEELLEFDKAIEQYEIAVNTNGKIINIPFLYDNRKQLLEAKAIAYYNMGLAYRDKSMLFSQGSSDYRELLQKSAESYKKSLKIEPANYDAQYNLALTYHILGLQTAALSGYCRAILIAPLNYEAHYNLGVLLKQKNMYKESYDAFKDAGSLMVFNANSFEAAHVYNMLNEVSKMSIAEYGYKPESIDDEAAFDDLEDVIKKRIRTASICKNYLQGT